MHECSQRTDMACFRDVQTAVTAAQGQALQSQGTCMCGLGYQMWISLKRASTASGTKARYMTCRMAGLQGWTWRLRAQTV